MVKLAVAANSQQSPSSPWLMSNLQKLYSPWVISKCVQVRLLSPPDSDLSLENMDTHHYYLYEYPVPSLFGKRGKSQLKLRHQTPPISSSLHKPGLPSIIPLLHTYWKYHTSTSTWPIIYTPYHYLSAPPSMSLGSLASSPGRRHSKSSPLLLKNTEA